MVHIKKAFTEGKYVDIVSGSADEITKALTASTVTGGSIAALLAGPDTTHMCYSGILAGVLASEFGMSSSLLLLARTGVGALAAAPILSLWLRPQTIGRQYP